MLHKINIVETRAITVYIDTDYDFEAVNEVKCKYDKGFYKLDEETIIDVSIDLEDSYED